MKRLREQANESTLEEVGERLRAMMPFVSGGKERAESGAQSS
jgi:ketol-acid reductoisomerase